MNEQVKMSDVFNLLKYANGKEIDTGDLIDSHGNWWATFNSKQAAMHAAIAINSYDQHVELIAKQAEQLKIIREAVGFAIPKIEILDVDAMGVSRMHNVQPWSVRDEVLSKLDAALSATE